MPTQVEKLQAHAGHLLDEFIRLKERYAMLHPMLFAADVINEHGSHESARGFSILRHSLFLSCAQDIAKLTSDKDERTPSIRRLVLAIDDSAVLAQLRSSFAELSFPAIADEPDAEIREALTRIELREQAERAQQFDEIVAQARARWQSLQVDPALTGFLHIRDRVSAHTEIRLVVDKYVRLDIGSLGINWGDLRRIIDLMQRLVEDLGLIIRSAGFAWDSLEDQLTKASTGFWTTG